MPPTIPTTTTRQIEPTTASRTTEPVTTKKATEEPVGIDFDKLDGLVQDETTTPKFTTVEMTSTEATEVTTKPAITKEVLTEGQLPESTTTKPVETTQPLTTAGTTEEVKVTVEFSVGLSDAYASKTDAEKESFRQDLEDDLKASFSASNPFEGGETRVRVTINQIQATRKRRSTSFEASVSVDYVAPAGTSADDASNVDLSNVASSVETAAKTTLSNDYADTVDQTSLSQLKATATSSVTSVTTTGTLLIVYYFFLHSGPLSKT